MSNTTVILLNKSDKHAASRRAIRLLVRWLYMYVFEL